jgi:prepilin peptidase CpaA
MAAIYDYRDFKIPNKLNGAGALITLVLAGDNM